MRKILRTIKYLTSHDTETVTCTISVNKCIEVQIVYRLIEIVFFLDLSVICLLQTYFLNLTIYLQNSIQSF